MSESNKPVRKYRANGVVVSVWENDGAKGNYHTFSLQRVFKDADGNWKTSPNLRASDLPTASELFRQAFLDFGIKSMGQAGDDIPF